MRQARRHHAELEFLALGYDTHVCIDCGGPTEALDHGLLRQVAESALEPVNILLLRLYVDFLILLLFNIKSLC